MVNDTVTERVIEGYRMPIPKTCTNEEAYDILRCALCCAVGRVFDAVCVRALCVLRHC